MKFIIPCWGVESTIGRMLDSILGQTLQDFHIVCVEDCSPDNTWKVLCDYQQKHPEKITLIKNETNLGAGKSRNRGVFETNETIQSDFLWIVDGDDYLYDSDVLKSIFEFFESNKNLDIINIGWTFQGKYDIARIGWPVASWGRVIKPYVYVKSPDSNIPYGNDVYAHFVMFDSVDDSKIGKFDHMCYVCPRPGRHHNHTEKNMNVAQTVGMKLMSHTFSKKNVIDSIMNCEAGTGKWIKKSFPGFKLKLKRNVSILMASFPYRKKWMIQCIEQLIGQCDNFYLWLNEYTDIPEELNKFDQNKLHVTLGDKNLKENGRYMFLEKPELQDDYCFICDDDINYPSNYVKTALDCFERRGENIVVAYYIHSTSGFESYHGSDAIVSIKTNWVIPHYRFGLGTAAFIPSVVKFNLTQDEIFANYDVEMLFGKQCNDRGIKVYTPKRPNGFVRFIKSKENDCGIDRFALHMNGNRDRARMTQNYISSKNQKSVSKENTVQNQIVKKPIVVSSRQKSSTVQKQTNGNSIYKFIKFAYG